MYVPNQPTNVEYITYLPTHQKHYAIKDSHEKMNDEDREKGIILMMNRRHAAFVVALVIQGHK